MCAHTHLGCRQLEREEVQHHLAAKVASIHIVAQKQQRLDACIETVKERNEIVVLAVNIANNVTRRLATAREHTHRRALLRAP